LDLAGGHASVDLVPAGTAFVTVVLSRVLGPPGDGGTDGSNGDGAVASCGPGDDGRICGAGDLCHDPPTCFGGLCVPNLKGDGTTCGTAPDTCHGPPGAAAPRPPSATAPPAACPTRATASPPARAACAAPPRSSPTARCAT
jgi:hypothetical protein